MIFIEFFSGSKVLSETFRKAGHKVLSIDSNPNLDPDICKRIEDLSIEDIPEEFRKPDVIWASPPCTKFSLLTVGRYWKLEAGFHIPKNQDAIDAMETVKSTIRFVELLNPKVYFVENPVGKLCKLNLIPISKYTVTYCQYGEKRRKPTNIWTNSRSWTPRPICYNGDPCHEASPRGSSETGVQGQKGNFERSKLPQELCDDIVAACEDSLKRTTTLWDF